MVFEVLCFVKLTVRSSYVAVGQGLAPPVKAPPHAWAQKERFDHCCRNRITLRKSARKRGQSSPAKQKKDTVWCPFLFT